MVDAAGSIDDAEGWDLAFHDVGVTIGDTVALASASGKAAAGNVRLSLPREFRGNGVWGMPRAAKNGRGSWRWQRTPGPAEEMQRGRCTGFAIRMLMNLGPLL
eukprot:scaffold1307_cov200-Pinguiococcus_pyrenoidosus.AAC.135